MKKKWASEIYDVGRAISETIPLITILWVVYTIKHGWFMTLRHTHITYMLRIFMDNKAWRWDSMGFLMGFMATTYGYVMRIEDHSPSSSETRTWQLNSWIFFGDWQHETWNSVDRCEDDESCSNPSIIYVRDEHGARVKSPSWLMIWDYRIIISGRWLFGLSSINWECFWPVLNIRSPKFASAMSM